MDFIAKSTEKSRVLRLTILNWYSNFLVKRAWYIIGFTTVVIVWAALNSIIQQLGAAPLPSFDIPSKGFEPRGSTIMRRIVAYNNLEAVVQEGIERLATSSRPPILTTYKIGDARQNRQCSVDPRSYLRAVTVYSALDDGETLFSAKHLRSICKLEQRIVRDQTSFPLYCEQVGNTTNGCCPSISIGFFVAKLNNRTNCLDIKESDVENTLELLRFCKTYLDSGMLSDMCLVSPALCNQVPSKCLSWNAVSSILKFMVDKDFAANLHSRDKLQYAVAFSSLMTPSNTFLDNLYVNTLNDIKRLKQDGVQLAAHDFYKLKTLMFEKRIFVDLSYVIMAMLLVVFLMWIYSRSLFVSLMGFATILYALVLAYWLYSIFFRLRFFPILNVLTAIFIVGIGADDIFVYILAWNHAKSKFPQTKKCLQPSYKDLICWTKYALEHAAASMFVTSFTTAAAFYVGYSSNITAVRCFAVFAGTSIMTNFLLMVTWFPAVVIIYERSKKDEEVQSPQVIGILHGMVVGQLALHLIKTVNRYFSEAKCCIKALPDKIFGVWIIRFIIKGRYVLVILLLGFAVGGLLCIVVYPKLQLPTSQKLQLFIKTHPMERYEFKIKEKLQIDITLGAETRKFPLIFVWGIHAKDTGSYLDPDNLGRLVWDTSFDITSRDAQAWISRFCKKIQNASFYGSGDCFLETFYNFAEQPCNSSTSRQCCELVRPLSNSQFRACVKEYTQLEFNKTTDKFHFVVDESGKIASIFLRFDSGQSFQFQFSPVDTFWNEVTSWADQQLSEAPAGMKNGWIISDLYFYDLQRSVAAGTPKTIGISIAISAAVLLLTTQNIIITIYAVCSISGIITVTIGTLVLSGWELNVLESMTMSVAVGLSIDITLHYGVGYFLCPDSGKRIDRVKYSLWHVGSAVTMGMATTFIAGLVMMPSNVFAYIQVGHFLMLNMSISWLYGTFFFLPLNAICGPEGDSGNIIAYFTRKKNEEEETQL